MLSTSEGGIQTVFIKGESGVHGYKSWRYPKGLREQHNEVVDNFFVFGKEYVTVIGNTVNIGVYNVEKERLFCLFNKRVEMDGQLNDGTEKIDKNSKSNDNNESKLINSEGN